MDTEAPQNGIVPSAQPAKLQNDVTFTNTFNGFSSPARNEKTKQCSKRSVSCIMDPIVLNNRFDPHVSCIMC
ncbi:predicted protein [Arabidopsis lyrata subsp. lyrata]|uniref:Predicted protein n=1 Tax=Arabidopsis lyrata subsp. lyrata TaxID=81972 RepID=D7KVE6_ARALL|nr:predicted protein [Arabidopsis lyrata subsp. lyrata]